MVIPVGLTAVSRTSDAFGERTVVGDDGAAVAERAEIFCRIETECACSADRADWASVRHRHVGLAAVLDHREVMPRRNPFDRSHVGGLAVEMNRHDRAGPGSYGRNDAFRVDREANRIDVGEHGTRAGHHDRQGGVRCGERRGDHLIARPDAERAQHERDGVGAVADANGVRRASRGGEFRFERLDFRSQHEPAPRDHPVDRAPHVRRIFARRKRHEGNLPDAHTRAVLSVAST